MPVLQVVEPLIYELDVIIGGGKSYRKVGGEYLDNAGEKPVFRDEVVAEIRRLIEVEKLSIKAVSERCNLSLTPVRRICRTLGLGRYSTDLPSNTRPARSSQVPFGWLLKDGVLIENPLEMKWVKTAWELRQGGQSFRAIANYFQDQAVPSKNGGKWHAKTIWQILEFNRDDGQDQATVPTKEEK